MPDGDRTKPQHGWQVEKTHPLLIKPLVDHLSQVIDPEIRMNILDLGLVRDVVVEKDKAVITMILTTPFCPYGPILLGAARQKAEEALGMSTIIEMGTEVWTPALMTGDAGEDWGLI